MFSKMLALKPRLPRPYSGFSVGTAVALLVLFLLRRRKRTRKRSPTVDVFLDRLASFSKLTVVEAERSSFRFQAERDFYSISPMIVVNEHVVIAMVGLPARGKSYISKAIIRYLQFLGCPAKLFNAGNKRRDKGLASQTSNFFDSSNAEAKNQREGIAMATLDELLDWLRSVPLGCACGIFDATNTTVERRLAVRERCAREPQDVRLVFLESICNDETILSNNYTMKLGNDDYKGVDSVVALQDFNERVQAYQDVYEPITDEEDGFSSSSSSTIPFRYVKTINAGQKVVSARCDGFLMSYVLPLMHSIHLRPRKVSLILAGESENDRIGFRGGDTPLSSAGLEYATAAYQLVKERESAKPAVLLLGTLRRYVQMAELFCTNGAPSERLVVKMKALDELCFGQLEGLRCGRLRKSFPEEHAKREADKLNYRYPGVGGESYADMIARLRDVVLYIERASGDVIIICDAAVARILVGYFHGVEVEQIPDIEMSPGVFELTRSHSAFETSHFNIDQGSVSMLAKKIDKNTLSLRKASQENSRIW